MFTFNVTGDELINLGRARKICVHQEQGDSITVVAVFGIEGIEVLEVLSLHETRDEASARVGHIQSFLAEKGLFLPQAP